MARTAARHAEPTPWHGRDLVDLDRYPIADLAAPRGRALIAAGRARLAATGLMLLPGFVAPAALAAMAAEAHALAPDAHRRDVWYGVGTGYRGAGPSADGRATRNAMGAIAGDRLDPAGAMRALYAWDALTDFIGALVGATVHRCADPLAALALTILGEGDEHGWHYDDNDFVVSLLIQDAASGGHFEVRPGSRDQADAHALESRMIAGARERLVRPNLEPGTLSLFQGRRSLHHVGRVAGARPRVIALLSYDRRPDMHFADGIRMAVFGRLA